MPVVNHAPRSPRARAEITSAIDELLSARLSSADLVKPPTFVPFKKSLEATLTAGEPLPGALTSQLSSGVKILLELTEPLDGVRVPDDLTDLGEPVAIAPGSLGNWSEFDD